MSSVDIDIAASCVQKSSPQIIDERKTSSYAPFAGSNPVRGPYVFAAPRIVTSL